MMVAVMPSVMCWARRMASAGGRECAPGECECGGEQYEFLVHGSSPFCLCVSEVSCTHR